MAESPPPDGKAVQQHHPLRKRQPLQTSRPFNIAHRGSNGEFPEQTVPAYMRAIEEGADFIGGDIVSTKDGVLICFPDVTLDETTDIAEHEEFSHRKTTNVVHGYTTTGFFTVDFTWQELQKLRVKQRFPFRDQQYNGKFKIISFDEYITIALDAPRVVGIYPGIKNPEFINREVKWSHGREFQQVFVETLKKYGYRGTYLSQEWLEQPAFIMSFCPTSLILIATQTDLPKILMTHDTTVRTQYTSQTYWQVTANYYLDHMKRYVVGIGPWKETVVPVINNHLQTPTDLISRAHAHSLQVHTYTFRNEQRFLHSNFHQDPCQEYDYWINKMRVDGLITDFTGTLHSFQERTSPLNSNDKDDSGSATGTQDNIASLP